MTVDFEELAQNSGYDSMRQYMALNYYLPRNFLTLIEIAEDLKISEGAIRLWMKREDLPAREKGHPRTREGFYCEQCKVLTSLRYIWYYKHLDRFICNKCKEDKVDQGESSKHFYRYKKRKKGGKRKV